MAKIHVFKVIRHGHLLLHRKCGTKDNVAKCPTEIDLSGVKGCFKRDDAQVAWRAVWELEGGKHPWRWIEGTFRTDEKGSLVKMEALKVLHPGEPPQAPGAGAKVP